MLRVKHLSNQLPLGLRPDVLYALGAGEFDSSFFSCLKRILVSKKYFPLVFSSSPPFFGFVGSIPAG